MLLESDPGGWPGTGHTAICLHVSLNVGLLGSDFYLDM